MAQGATQKEPWQDLLGKEQLGNGGAEIH